MDIQRERYWRRRLRRLRLDAEPIAEQLERQRRTTIVLTAIPAAIGLIFLAIFAGFGRPDVGAALVAVVILPIVALAWVEFARLRGGAAAYLKERADNARSS